VPARDANLKLLLAEVDHGIESQAFHPPALDIEPFRPGLLWDRDFGEQGTSVETDCAIQCVPAPVAEQSLELHYIAREHARLKGNRFATANDRILAQDAPQPCKGLAQVLPCLGFEMRAPQQGHQLVGAVRLRGRAGQKGEQGSQLLAGQIQGPIRPAQLEGAEQRKPKCWCLHSVQTRQRALARSR
jgi:hypothetical protein